MAIRSRKPASILTKSLPNSRLHETPGDSQPRRICETNMTTTTSINLGNNESLSRSIVRNSDGSFTAVTFSASRTFKTYKGAVKWLAARCK